MKSLSPINFVKSNQIPVLLIHGDEDHTVPIGQSILIFDKLKERSAPELYVVKGGKHGNFGDLETAKMDVTMLAFLMKHL